MEQGSEAEEGGATPGGLEEVKASEVAAAEPAMMPAVASSGDPTSRPHCRRRGRK